MSTKLPLGTIGKKNREISGYTGLRNLPYLVRCNNCGFELSGTKGTIDSPCKKCSYIKPWQDLRKQIYYKYKYNAGLKNVAFEISFDDFCHTISLNCHYCGSQPSRIWESRRKFDKQIVYNGVDRVDNDLGYVNGNYVPCCTFCNRMKSDLSLMVFKEYVKLWSKRFESW